MQLQVAVGAGDDPRPRAGQRPRDDRRLFRADLGGMLRRIARRRHGAAGRGSSPPPSRTITRPSPRPATPIAGCCGAASRCTNISATKLHTKLLVLDDIVHIGSSNFDYPQPLSQHGDDAAGRRSGVRRSLMRSYFEHELGDSSAITRGRACARPAACSACAQADRLSFLVTSLDYTVTRRLNFARRSGR